jgi:hypothetical protein
MENTTKQTTVDAKLKELFKNTGLECYQYEGFETAEELIENMRQEISEDEVNAYFADILGFSPEDLGKDGPDGTPLVKTRTRNQLTALLDAYVSGPGAAPRTGTAWGAYNAVTYWVDHVASTRDTAKEGTGLARAFSAQFGRGAITKQEAFKKILARANVALAA